MNIPPPIDISQLVPVTEMTGDDDEDAALLRQAYGEAASFLSDFHWCHGIKEAYFGLGIGGIVAVFLFRVDGDPQVDEWLWVVAGDLPTVYLVTDDASTPRNALEVYCDLMSDWVSAVRGRSLIG